MENLIISGIEGPLADQGPVEIVERKGLGHPDTICDSLAETLSRALGRLYFERFGRVLHHNVDKILLCGGAARPRFGGGKVTAPIRIFLAGRATRKVRGKKLPLDDLVHDTVQAWFGRNLPGLDPARHLKVECLWRPVSSDLAELFEREGGNRGPLANDTSIGVGYAPLSPLEEMVLAVEMEFHRTWVRARHPEFGPDVKVMGIRRGTKVELTVPCAFIDRYVEDERDYLRKKARLASFLGHWAMPFWPKRVEVRVNTADAPGSPYLTVTGTSAEAGDDGEAGRGNRMNGLITPYRPMTLEAFCGKNPLTHTGKLYQKAAQEIAGKVAALPGAAAAECYLVSRIGKPIGEPLAVEVRLKPRKGERVAGFRKAVGKIVQVELDRLPGYWRGMLGDPWHD
jgi:S-adenosylmethionine synthetase